MIRLSDLVTPVTTDQLTTTLISNLETLGIPARSWRRGGAYRSILRVVAASGAAFSSVGSAFASSGFLELATGPWLTLLARNVFTVERIEASFATGKVTLTNGGGGVFTYGPGEATFKNFTTGQTYVNAAAIALGATSTQTVDVRASNAGAIGTSGPGAIDTLVTQMTGVTVSNPAAVIGNDAESDADLRAACRGRLAAISVRGPRGAYQFAITRAPRLDGSTVNINRVQVSPFSSVGIVNAYAAAPSGAPIADDLTAARLYIEQIARPDTVTVNLYPAAEVPLTRNLVLWARRVDGLTAADIQAAAIANLIEATKTYPVGGIPKAPSTQGYLYASFLEGLCKQADASIFSVDGAGPDLALSFGQVASLSVTVSVRVVDVS